MPPELVAVPPHEDQPGIQAPENLAPDLPPASMSGTAC